MTPDSEKSEWVERELLLAQEEKKVILPLLLRGRRFPLLITTQYVDVTKGQLSLVAFYERLGQVASPKPKKENSTAISPQEKEIPALPQFTQRRLSGKLLVGVGISISAVVTIGILAFAFLTRLNGNGFFDKMPEQSIGLLLGVAAGVLTTLLTILSVSIYTQWRQNKSNREQVYGLLYLLIEKAEDAADNGFAVELEPFETIYRQEGLSTILKEDDLTFAAHDLWKTARRYNLGLNQPGGAQRTDELRRGAEILRKKLAQVFQSLKFR